MNIYAQSLIKLSIAVVIICAVWGVVYYKCSNGRCEKAFRALSIVFMIASLYIILSHTVIGREMGDSHTFFFAAQYSNEFLREMFMNALLYLPLGLSLSVFAGPWTILIAFILSTGIECWQYCCGTGMAQGTDVIMNTLGAAIGTVPWLMVHNRCRSDS